MTSASIHLDTVRPDQLLEGAMSGGVVIVQGKSVSARGAADLKKDVDNVVSYLRRIGLGAGDRVGIRGPNSYEWLVTDLALISRGCISVCVPPEAPEFDYMPAAALLEHLRLKTLFHASPRGQAVSSAPGVVDLSKILESASQEMETDREQHTQLASSDIFTVVFSSGSTGRLKRLPISWSSIQKNVEAFGNTFGLTGDDRILVVLPFSSFQQRYLVYCAIWFGSRIVLARPENFLNSLRYGKPTVILGPPSFYEIVEQRFSALPSWRRHVMLGLSRLATLFSKRLGAVVGARLFRSFHQLYGGDVRLMLIGSAPVKRGTLVLFRLAGFPLYQCYGMTEAGWIAWNSPRANKSGTVGVPAFPGTVKLTDDGEVLVSRPWNQCSSYETFEADVADPGVFLPENTVATGDIGVFDTDGYLVLTGRRKNVIVTLGGVKISPEEVEEQISALDTVKHAVVFDHPRMSSLAAAIWMHGKGRDDRKKTIDFIKALNAGTLRRTPILGVVFPTMSLSVENGLLTRNTKIDRSGVRSALQGLLLPLGSGSDELDADGKPT